MFIDMQRPHQKPDLIVCFKSVFQVLFVPPLAVPGVRWDSLVPPTKITSANPGYDIKVDGLIHSNSTCSDLPRIVAFVQVTKYFLLGSYTKLDYLLIFHDCGPVAGRAWRNFSGGRGTHLYRAHKFQMHSLDSRSPRTTQSSPSVLGRLSSRSPQVSYREKWSRSVATMSVFTPLRICTTRIRVSSLVAPLA